MGNPWVWYPALAAAGWLLIRSVRPWRPERVVLAGWGFQYLPWLAVARPLFFFYMTPIVPFMMIALARGLASLKELGWPFRVLVYVFLFGGVTALLVYFYPVLTAVNLPYELWKRRMWRSSWI